MLLLGIAMATVGLYGGIAYGQDPPGITEAPLDQWEQNITEWSGSLQDPPPFRINNVWLTVKSTLTSSVSVYTQNAQCLGCPVELNTGLTSGEIKTFLVQSNFANYIEVRETGSGGQQEVVFCSARVQPLREQGSYWLIVYSDTSSPSHVGCDLVLTDDPPNLNLPILYAFLVYLGLAVIWILISQIRCCCRKTGSLDFPDDTQQLELKGNINAAFSLADEPEIKFRTSVDDHVASTEIRSEDKEPDSHGAHREPAKAEERPAAPKLKRLKSLDCFRGFSLVVMIFVNYGGGGYWFFEHAHWDGLLVADLVFPWFVWMMGSAITLSIRGMLKRGIPRWRIAIHIFTRSAELFFIGVCIGARTSNDVKLMRIPGVLQRLGFTYFITALLHLPFVKVNDHIPCCAPLRDIFLYWPEWIIHCAILGLQVALTYALPVPGCPTGYVGAGGLHQGGHYENCTGGAAGYIDRVILTENHLFQWPTIRELYKTEIPFDPEGILGTLTSIFMCFLGLQAGKILTTYRQPTGRCVRWLLWGVVTGGLGALLCKCSQAEGWVPLNKNLWSVSFVLALTGMAFVVLLVLYLVIDVAGWWSGAPFVYPGMNSIAIYICHTVFSTYFPISWQWPDYEQHWQRLFRAVWGATWWTIVAYVMYLKKVFIAL